MADKHEYDVEKTQSDKDINEDTLVMREEIENSRIEAVALGMSMRSVCSIRLSYPPPINKLLLFSCFITDSCSCHR